MNTQKETSTSIVRLHNQTRRKIKIEAAKKEMTMQDFTEWLVSAYIGDQIEESTNARGEAIKG